MLPVRGAHASNFLLYSVFHLIVILCGLTLLPTLLNFYKVK